MNRIELLRDYMKKSGVNACIIPTADPHLNEYIPECYKLRQWLSGFTGSAGTLVVTENDSGLWTDGRYYIQAEKELEGTDIKLYRASEKECVKIHTFLQDKLKSGSFVGVDGRLFSKNQLDKIISELEKEKINVNTDFRPEKIWSSCPNKPCEKAFVLEEQYSGESLCKKLEKVRKKMKEKSFTHYLSSSPECIMWLLNIRGNDIRHTPVMLSYILISQNNAILYTDREKINEEVERYLNNNKISLKDYDAIFADLGNTDENSFLAADYSMTNYNLIKAVKCAYKDCDDFIYNLKCIKTEKEIENIKKAYIKENIALTKSFYEIYHSSGINECDVSDIIEKHRRKSEGYFSPSFDTIAAFGKNAAMMHYSAHESSCAKIENSGLLLVDTGGQYFEGTTDTTRTLVVGDITDEQCENLTLVLKGNISLLMSVFPEGSTGQSIDMAARAPLWKKGIDYRCGTGHGVGCFLSVHEGPQRISQLCKEMLLPGMTVTDEPGVYIEGEYGIRIENHLCVRRFKKTEYGEFLCFEVLNFCPIGTAHLKNELLDKEQLKWLNSYNERCRELLLEHLTKEENEWLKIYTKAI